MGIELVKSLDDVGEVEGEDGGGLPVVRVGEGGEVGGEDGVGWVGVIGCAAGFEVEYGGGVGDGLDADLGVGVIGRGCGCGYFRDRFALFDEGPGGDGRIEVNDGFEAGFVLAGCVVRAPLPAGLIEEDADAGLAQVIACSGGGGFEDADDWPLPRGCECGEKQQEGEGSWLHVGSVYLARAIIFDFSYSPECCSTCSVQLALNSVDAPSAFVTSPAMSSCTMRRSWNGRSYVSDQIT